MDPAWEENKLGSGSTADVHRGFEESENGIIEVAVKVTDRLIILERNKDKPNFEEFLDNIMYTADEIR